MALLNKAQKGIYLSIQSGKIAHRVQEATNTSKSRQLDSGKVIHEELYDSLEGYVKNVQFKDGEYGTQLIITFDNDGEVAHLQMPLSSSPSATFLKCLPNVDPAKALKLTPKMVEQDGKRKTSLFLNQDGAAVKWFWTKDNPGNLPSLKKVKIKGRETWDDSDQIDFLKAYVNDEFLPKLKGTSVEINEEANDDEVPF